MAEMTPRERIIAVSHKKRADKLPFFHQWTHCHTGWAERVCRNRGMGLFWRRPGWRVTIHDVEVTEQYVVAEAGTVIRRTYVTPVGTVYADEKRDPGVGQWHAERSWRDKAPCLTEHPIKGPEDYKVMKYIAEHTEYTADYFPVEQAKEWLGEDGIVVDVHYHQPMQTLMLDWIGTRGGRFFIHHAKYPDLVEDLCQALSKSRESLYEIQAKSPADFVWLADNVDSVLDNPRFFEKYLMPEYEKMAKVFHEHGKLFAVHFDGRTNSLKHLIAKTPIDIIEALTWPPMGDLPIGEALSVWKDKVIWSGFPGSVYVLGPEATKKHALNLLRDVIPGDRLAIEMSTENLVSNENLTMLTSVLENADLPLTEEKIDRIAASLS